MQLHRLTLIPLEGTFAIAKLPPDAAIPAWASNGPFFSILRERRRHQHDRPPG
jgi:hypothetical protein